MATVKEIAEQADVSIGTVSNVLNNLPTVREAARRRVLEAIEMAANNKCGVKVEDVK